MPSSSSGLVCSCGGLAASQRKSWPLTPVLREAGCGKVSGDEREMVPGSPHAECLALWTCVALPASPSALLV